MENINDKKDMKFLYEELADKLGIDIITHQLNKNSNYHNIVKVQLGNYIKYHLQLIDENTGKKARIDIQDDILKNIDELTGALAIDLNDEEIENVIKNLKLIYKMSIFVSDKGIYLNDWDLVIDKRKNKILGFSLKANNHYLCFNSMEDMYAYLNEHEPSKKIVR